MLSVEDLPFVYETCSFENSRNKSLSFCRTILKLSVYAFFAECWKSDVGAFRCDQLKRGYFLKTNEKLKIIFRIFLRASKETL